jgi:hypothetical protein
MGRGQRRGALSELAYDGKRMAFVCAYLRVHDHAILRSESSSPVPTSSNHEQGSSKHNTVSDISRPLPFIYVSRMLVHEHLKCVAVFSLSSLFLWLNFYCSGPWASLAHMQLTPRASNEPKDMFCQRLLLNIQSIEHVLQQAKELLNDNRPLPSVLPPEILADVFGHIRDGCVYNKPSWVSVAHVSRRWRAVALSSPELWTRLDTDILPYQLWELILPRSGAMPLHLTMGKKQALDLEAFVLTTRWQQYSQRIQSLEMYDGVYTSSEETSNIFGSPLLSLEHLSVCIDPDSGDGDATLFSIPEDVTFPTLKTLHIEHFPFPWDHPIYTSVQSLELKLSDYRRYLFPDEAELALLFSRMTRLEDLTILDCFEIKGTSETTCITPPPSLKILRTDSTAALSTLACISPSPSLTIHVQISDELRPGPQTEALGSFFSRCASSKYPLTAYLLRRVSHQHGKAWESVQLWRNSDPDTSPPCTTISSYQYGPASDLTLILTAAHLENITEARIEIDEPVPALSLPNLLRRSPRLHTLRLQGQSLARLVPVLPSFEPDPITDEAIFLSQLRIITIQDVAEPDRTAALNALIPFIAWLQRRKECGTPIQEVHIARYLVAGSGAAGLQYLLRRVAGAVWLV